MKYVIPKSLKVSHGLSQNTSKIHSENNHEPAIHAFARLATQMNQAPRPVAFFGNLSTRKGHFRWPFSGGEKNPNIMILDESTFINMIKTRIKPYSLHLHLKVAICPILMLTSGIYIYNHIFTSLQRLRSQAPNGNACEAWPPRKTDQMTSPEAVIDPMIDPWPRVDGFRSDPQPFFVDKSVFLMTLTSLEVFGYLLPTFFCFFEGGGGMFTIILYTLFCTWNLVGLFCFLEKSTNMRAFPKLWGTPGKPKNLNAHSKAAEPERHEPMVPWDLPMGCNGSKYQMPETVLPRTFKSEYVHCTCFPYK